MPRMSSHRSQALICVTLSLSLACRAGDATEQVQLPEPEAAVFTLVLLRTGETPPELTDERRAELFDGHFAFMGAQAQTGRLLLSGPFGGDKSSEDLRGIFLFDEPDAARGLELAMGDPTTRAGIFRQEAFPIATLDILRQLPAMEQVRQEARAAAGEDMDRPDVRPYVVLIANDGEAAAPLLGHAALAPSVVLFGRLGPPRDGAMFAVLALDGTGEARARLAIANEGGVPFELSQWYATPALLELTLNGPPVPGD